MLGAPVPGLRSRRKYSRGRVKDLGLHYGPAGVLAADDEDAAVRQLRPRVTDARDPQAGNIQHLRGGRNRPERDRRHHGERCEQGGFMRKLRCGSGQATDRCDDLHF